MRYCLSNVGHMTVRRQTAEGEAQTFINTPSWHPCGCWGHCHCHPWPKVYPQYWCSQCHCYTYYPHVHPPICVDDLLGRDERLREEGRRQERERRRRKKHPNLPYVDITPALPRYRCY